jgi:serine/threonine-protein kinase HipA
LILRLFASEDTASTPVTERLERLWRRAGNFVPAWRQIAIIPEPGPPIDRATYATLFPGTEIPPDQHPHGFPFVGHGLPDDVFRLDAGGWTGIVPTEATRPPHYVWLLDRTGAFAYRERIWEDDPLSVTKGHIHLGSQFNLAIPALFFFRRLARRSQLDSTRACRLQIDLEGIANRGMVAYRQDRSVDDFAIDEPKGATTSNHLTSSLEARIAEIVSDPKAVAISLVGEVVLAMRPDLASDSALSEQLLRRQRQDGGGTFNYLGVLGTGGWRRGDVIMNGTRVGTLQETSTGTRFEYDEAYRRRDDAIPVSPTLPLTRGSYETLGMLPFFANLLPEGSRLAWTSERLGLDPNDRFGLLLATGRNTIGAVEIRPAATEDR